MFLKLILILVLLFSCNKSSQRSVTSSDQDVSIYNTPHGVVVDDDAHIIYLSDRGSGYLHSYTCAGGELGSIFLDTLNNFVSGINISSDNVYACNQQSSTVSIINESEQRTS